MKANIFIYTTVAMLMFSCCSVEESYYATSAESAFEEPTVVLENYSTTAPISPNLEFNFFSIDSFFQTAERAQIQTDIPERMKVSKPVDVKVYLNFDEIDSLTSHGTTPVSRYMTVTCYGDAFEVFPESEEQILSTLYPNSWTFTVTPRKAGRQVLHIRIQAKIMVDGIESSRTLETKAIPVTVSVGVQSIIDQWELILTAILIPTAVGIGGYYINKRKNLND